MDQGTIFLCHCNSGTMPDDVVELHQLEAYACSGYSDFTQRPARHKKKRKSVNRLQKTSTHLRDTRRLLTKSCNHSHSSPHRTASCGATTAQLLTLKLKRYKQPSWKNHATTPPRFLIYLAVTADLICTPWNMKTARFCLHRQPCKNPL